MATAEVIYLVQAHVCNQVGLLIYLICLIYLINLINLIYLVQAHMCNQVGLLINWAAQAEGNNELCDYVDDARLARRMVM